MVEGEGVLHLAGARPRPVAPRGLLACRSRSGRAAFSACCGVLLGARARASVGDACDSACWRIRAKTRMNMFTGRRKSAGDRSAGGCLPDAGISAHEKSNLGLQDVLTMIRQKTPTLTASAYKWPTCTNLHSRKIFSGAFHTRCECPGTMETENMPTVEIRSTVAYVFTYVKGRELYKRKKDKQHEPNALRANLQFLL